MKSKITIILTVLALLLFPNVNIGQTPNLGTAANFVLFTSIGAVGNNGISQLTGNVGSNGGSITGFGNVNGVMDNTNGASAQCSSDLLSTYNVLNAAIPNYFLAPLLGNGDTLIAGVYSIAGATTMNLNLTLDAQGNANAVFIFQIQGPLSTNANTKVKLINGALACNVFWKIEGLVSMASGTSMKGTIIANNAAINMSTGDTLEGRALSTTGAITINGVMAYTPVGCGSPVLTGPAAPSLLSTVCYALFSTNGPVSNAGVSLITGDVGTNVGLTTGFDSINVTGTIHPIPDGSTSVCAADLGTVYTYLNLLAPDIELLYPAQFGNNLVLTPHTYLMNAAVTFTDTLYLNAMGDSNAVFVFQVNGALSTSTFSKVILTNGTQAKNVFWEINGAVQINDYSVFNGTIICNNGAISLNTGVLLNGRALTTTGALTTAAITAIIPPGCSFTSSPAIISGALNQTKCTGDSVRFSVIATGTGLSYQWRKGTTNLINGGNISGATTATLVINPVTITDSSTKYNVVITGTYSPFLVSPNYSLTVNTAPTTLIISGQTSFCNGDSITLDAGIHSSYNWSNGRTNEAITVSTGGIYTVTVSMNTVCARTAHKTATAQPLPVPLILPSGLSNLCGGGSAILNLGATFASYTWSTGASTQSLTINAGGTYTITVTSANGCTGTASFTDINVTCNTPLTNPTTNIAGTSATANWVLADCFYNNSIRISLHNANVWTTYILGSNAHYSFSGLAHSTAYDWQIRTNCNSAQTLFSPWSSTQTFTTLSHRDEAVQSNTVAGFSIFPNPAAESATIIFSSDMSGTFTIKLMDIVGQIVRTETGNAGIGENTFLMNLNGVAKGIYIVQLGIGNTINNVKLIVQ